MATLRRIDRDERAARMARRHRIAAQHRAADVTQAAASMVCLHGTDPATVYLSAWARVDDLRHAAMDDALYTDRSLVKHMAMRRTLFVFPRATLRAAQAGASARVARTEGKRLVADVEKARLHTDGARWLDEVSQQTLAVLSDGRQATMAELRDEIPLLAGRMDYGEGRSWAGAVAVAPRVLTVLSVSGQVLRATNAGTWRTSRPRWASTRSWLGAEIEPCSEAAGEARLVELWLRAFGPGTTADLKWWLGSTLGGVRAALATVGAVEVQLHRGTGWVLADDVEPEPAVEPWSALLPGLDPTTMGWAERDWYLGPHKAQVFDTNGNAGPTAWWDGRIVGGWAQDSAGVAVLQLLEDVEPDGVAALTQDAERLTAWFAGMRVLPMYPTPLSKALAPSR